MNFNSCVKIIQIEILYFFLNFIKKKPGSQVLSAFHEKHPNSKYPVWQKMSEGAWQVSFNEDFHQAIALFNDQGGWIVSKSFTQFPLLPQNIRDAFEAQFNKELIKRVYALQFKKANLYEFLVNENNKTKSLLFSTSGTLLSSSFFKNDRL